MLGGAGPSDYGVRGKDEKRGVNHENRLKCSTKGIRGLSEKFPT